MKTRHLVALSVAVVSASFVSVLNAQMRSKSQGTGAYVATPGRSAPASLSGASQAPLIFDISSIAFSGNSPVALPLPSGGSGSGAVEYSSSTPSICTVSGSSLVPIAPGTCTVVATKAGSGVYGPVSISSNKVITPLNQAPLAFSIPPTLSFSNGTATLPTATGGSGSGSVSYASDTPAVCAVAGNSVTVVGLGTCVVVATKAGSDAMGPITARAEFSTEATQPQTTPVAFSLSGITWSGATATLPVATGGDGNGQYDYVASGSCSRSGATLTKTATGACTVTATRMASGIFRASDPVTSTIQIAGEPQPTAINFNIASLTFASNSNTVTLPAASGGDGTASFTYSTSSSTCTVSGTTLTRVSGGDCTVTATKPASGLYSEKSFSSTVSIPSRCQIVSSSSSCPTGYRAASKAEALSHCGTVMVSNTSAQLNVYVTDGKWLRGSMNPTTGTRSFSQYIEGYGGWYSVDSNSNIVLEPNTLRAPTFTAQSMSGLWPGSLSQNVRGVCVW